MNSQHRVKIRNELYEKTWKCWNKNTIDGIFHREFLCGHYITTRLHDFESHCYNTVRINMNLLSDFRVIIMWVNVLLLEVSSTSFYTFFFYVSYVFLFSYGEVMIEEEYTTCSSFTFPLWPKIRVTLHLTDSVSLAIVNIYEAT